MNGREMSYKMAVIHVCDVRHFFPVTEVCTAVTYPVPHNSCYQAPSGSVARYAVDIYTGKHLQYP